MEIGAPGDGRAKTAITHFRPVAEVAGLASGQAPGEGDATGEPELLIEALEMRQLGLAVGALADVEDARTQEGTGIGRGSSAGSQAPRAAARSRKRLKAGPSLAPGS